MGLGSVQPPLCTPVESFIAFIEDRSNFSNSNSYLARVELFVKAFSIVEW